MDDGPSVESCPSPSSLEAFAVDGIDPGGSIASHVHRCDACAQYVIVSRENARFLASMPSVRLAPSPREPKPVSSSIAPGYTIVREIARGGQGIVYEGVQIDTKRRVAIKMLHYAALGADDGRQRLRLEREAEIAAMLRHPGIATIYESSEINDDGRMLVMEYVDGVRLDDWLAQIGEPKSLTRETLRDRLLVLQRVCEAVEHAHRQGVIHRDLKPGNVLVRTPKEHVDRAGTGEHEIGPTPCLLDFGIARPHSREQDDPLYTMTGAFVGTLAYTSPEQVSGDPERVDTRSDVYALGVLLYEVIVGHRPYETDGPLHAALEQITSRDPVRVKGMDGELWTIIAKAMNKDVHRRYQSAGALGEDIRRYLAGEAIDARRDSTLYVLRKALWKRKELTIFAAAAVVGVTVFGIIMAWQAGMLRIERNQKTRALREQNITLGRTLTVTGDTLGAARYLRNEIRVSPDENSFYSIDPLTRRAAWGLLEAATYDPRLCEIDTNAELSDTNLPGNTPAILHLQNDVVTLTRANGIVQSWRVSDGSSTEPAQLTPVFLPSDDEHVRLSGSTRFAATWSRSSLRTIDMQTGENVANISLDKVGLIDGSFTADGARFGATMSNGEIWIFPVSLETHYVLPAAQENGSRLTAPVFTSDGAFTLVATDRSCIESLYVFAQLDQIARGEMAMQLSRFQSQSEFDFSSIHVSQRSPVAVAVHPDLLFMFRADNVLNPTSQQQSRLLRSDGEWAGEAAFSADGSRMFVARKDRRVSVWDTNGLLVTGSEPTEGPPAQYVTGQLHGECVLLAPDEHGARLAALDHTGMLTVFDVDASWKRTVNPWDQISNVNPGSVSAVVWKKKCILIGAKDSPRVRVFDPAGNASRRSVQAHVGGVEHIVTGVAVNPLDTSQCVSVGRDGVCVLWDDADTMLEADRTIECLGPANDVVWSPDGTWLAVACDADSQVAVFRDLDSHQVNRAEISIPGVGEARRVAVHPDGSLIVAIFAAEPRSEQATTLAMIDPQSGKTRTMSHEIDRPSAIRFSANGDRLFVGSENARMYICNPMTGSVQREGPILHSGILDLAPDPNGAVVYAALRTSGFYVLDAESGQELARVAGPDDAEWRTTCIDVSNDVIVTGHANSRLSLSDIGRLMQSTKLNINLTFGQHETR